MNIWLADTGPLLAYLVSEEQHHAWAVETAKQAPTEVYCCEAVITEVFFLLNRERYPPEPLFGLIEAGFLRCEFDFRREFRQVRDLMARYRAQPMSYADACLMRLAELQPGAQIWTLDRHFQIYRRRNRQPLSLVAPW